MIIQLLKEVDALLEGHFQLTSGRHTDKYIQCAKLLQYPDKAEKAVSEIVKKLEGLEIDLIVGPALGGIIVGYELGRQIKKPAVFTEREDGKMALKRGFAINKGDRVLIVEDVVTTGKSSYEAISVVKEQGGVVVGIATLIDRSRGDIIYPLYAAGKIQIETYDPNDCPLCTMGLPIVKPGSRIFV